MAAIAEIRVVNLHYAKQNNYYDDLTFHFLTEAGIPSNGAITFPNGNGKGALLQAINQIFLPETEWGNNNENTPLHYFMKGNKFAPYTFYIMIEWWISYNRRLMTGIVMTAEEVTDPKPEYRIKYRLFGKKYVKNEYTIQRVPVWDKENNTVVDFSVFENHVKEQKGMFSYAPSGKGKFFKECRTHGVFESDWAELKKINRYEAGIGPYFEQKKATKNETFFRNMLIPSIVDRNEIINGIDIQSQLSQQFKDSASIANNLPHLLAREKYHREILEMVLLFDAPIKNYEFAEKQIIEHKRTGENILGNIDEKLQELENQKEKLNNQTSELENQRDENEWEKDNLKYVKSLRDLREKQEEQEQADLDQKDAAFDKETADNKQGEAERKLLVKKYQVEEKKYQAIEADIKRLEQSAEMIEISTKERAIKQTIEEQWAENKEDLLQVQAQYQAFTQQKKKEATNLVQESQELATAIGRLDVQLSTVTNRTKEFETLLGKAKEKFGYSVHVKPEHAKASLLKEIEANQFLQREAEIEEPSLLAKQEKLAEEVWTLNNEKNSIKKQQREVKERLPQQQRQQFEWMNQVSRLLKLTPDECLATYDWLQSVLPALQDLREKREKRVRELTVEVLKLEQQLQISNEDRFLFNADIQRISEKLAHYNVYHQTGSEFLMELKEEERERYNRQFSSLKYSIIVQTQNLEELRRKLQFHDELLQSPVNLVEARQLDQLSDSNFLFWNQADEFVEQPEKWKGFLQASQDEKVKLEEEIQKVAQEIEEIQVLIQDVQRFPQTDSADFLKQELIRLNNRCEQLENELTTMGSKQTELKKKIEDNKTKQKNAGLILKEKEKDWRELEIFIERLHQHQEDVTLESTLSTELSQKQSKLEALTQQATDGDEELKEWQTYYADWKARMLQKVDRIAKIIPNVEFPKESRVEAGMDEISTPILPDSLFDSIMETVAQHDELTHTLEQKSSKIAELKGMNKVNIGLVQDAKEELLKCDPEGLSLSEPVEPLDFLKQQKERAITNAWHTAQRLQSAEKTLESLTAVVGRIEEQVNGLIEDIRQNQKCAVDDWENVDLEVKGKEIAEESRRIQSELSAQDTALKELQIMQNTLEKARPTIAVLIGAPPSLVFSMKEKIDGLIETINQVVEDWSGEFEKRKRRRTEAFNALNRSKRKSLEDIKVSNWDEKTKQNLLEQYNAMDVANLPSTVETIEGIRALSKYELEVMEEDKKKGVEARERWVRYAAQFSSNIAKAIIEMAESMELKNRGGFTFPLVKIRNKRKLSTKADDFQVALERYFDESIKKVNQMNIPVDSMTIREINQVINIADIVYTALGNQYPLFDIYYLDKDNVFMYDSPRPEYYVDWEVLNEGSLTNPAGSGGQKVAGRTIMFLMMMSHKRKVADKDWQFFYMDNPFANAISASVVDPIFAITEALNYQLIVVAPPELMKAEISMKFPSLHDLSFEKVPTGKSRVLVTRRQYLSPSGFMTEAFEDEVIGFSAVKNTDVEQGEFILD
jgi:hypothetical protein